MIGFRETTLDQLSTDHTIDVSTLTATARLSVPIRVSPGRESFSPNLSLSYGSRGRNSAFGVDRSAVGPVSISVNGTPATAFPAPTNPRAAGDPFGGLPAKTLGAAFATGLKWQHTIVVNNAGNLAAGAGSASLFALDKLRDILLVVEYRI